jgi:hypothetical protein
MNHPAHGKQASRTSFQDGMPWRKGGALKIHLLWLDNPSQVG